ncbi:UPF0481 protein At3g47200-like [Neltuma alba]|uniref:UPF0481 protein At3g47200-like n=1 Tax=Neltuma alba TaxID=207710 RepID=UPI0010A40D8B|nr:UPF0481 protein At3g47200-like [Prosopis alba]
MAEVTDSETKDPEVLGSPPQTISTCSEDTIAPEIKEQGFQIDPYIMEMETWSTGAPLMSSGLHTVQSCGPQMTDQYSVDIHPAMNIPNQTCAAQYSDDVSIADVIVSQSAQQAVQGCGPQMTDQYSVDIHPAMNIPVSAQQTNQTCAAQYSDDVSIADVIVSQSAQQAIDIRTPQMSASRLVVTKDIEELIQDCGDGHLSPHCCIYRVPIKLRDLKKNAYTPKVVSIGPFHYRNEELQDMQRHKHILFKRFTKRTKSSCCELVEFVQQLEPRVRASYSDTIDLTEKELVKLTLIDAVFIIELFIMPHFRDEEPEDAKLSQPWLADSIRLDLLLLENQLPFFVIEKLFNEALPHDRRYGLPSFLELTHNYFAYRNRQELGPHSSVDMKHFTDLLRLFYKKRKTSERKPNTEGKDEWTRVPKDGSRILLYNANALEEAGVTLKGGESEHLLDVEFSGNILKIPHIVVDDNTELLFRNMIALEQCHYPGNADITDYALLLDWLINTEKDVDLLVRENIVRNYLGDTKDVATLFNGLSDNVVQSTISPHYSDTCKKLNGYCERPRHRWKATLRRDYCPTPTATVASVFACLTLFLTILSILQAAI